MDILHIIPRGLIFLPRCGIAPPFVALQQSMANALIGLFILFIGIRSA